VRSIRKYMIEELRKLLKHATIYGAGNVLGKLVGFFMIPFYTHYLTPADYGTLELLDLSLTLTALVLTMWLNAAVVRQYNDFGESKDRNQAVSTVLIFAFFIGVVVAAAGIQFSRPLSTLILNSPNFHFYVSLEALSFLVSSLNVVCMSYLRARQRSTFVVGIGLISLFLSLLLNIYFIAIQHTGAVGVLYSGLISSTLITVFLAIQTVRNVKLSFSYSKLKGIIAFGAPLIITSAATFSVNFSDRFFLRHFSTISTVGIYALGYKFGFILSLLVVQPFDMIWQARIYDIAKQDQGGGMFSRLFEYYFFVLVMTALALSIGIKELLSWISPADFHAAYRVVPIVALAYVFQGTNRFFLAGTYIAKKTTYLGPVGLASTGANIGLNLLLISRYGMLGAAWATAFSFFFMSTLSFIVSQKVYRIPYVFTRVVMLAGLSILTYFASSLVALPSFALQVSLKVALFVAFPMVLYLSGFFSKKEVEKGKRFTQAILIRYHLLSPAESE
jgi:O-antigen/teichoic acid export membrane protein